MVSRIPQLIDRLMEKSINPQALLINNPDVNSESEYSDDESDYAFTFNDMDEEDQLKYLLDRTMDKIKALEKRKRPMDLRKFVCYKNLGLDADDRLEELKKSGLLDTKVKKNKKRKVFKPKPKPKRKPLSLLNEKYLGPNGYDYKQEEEDERIARERQDDGIDFSNDSDWLSDWEQVGHDDREYGEYYEKKFDVGVEKDENFYDYHDSNDDGHNDEDEDSNNDSNEDSNCGSNDDSNDDSGDDSKDDSKDNQEDNSNDEPNNSSNGGSNGGSNDDSNNDNSNNNSNDEPNDDSNGELNQGPGDDDDGDDEDNNDEDDSDTASEVSSGISIGSDDDIFFSDNPDTSDSNSNVYDSDTDTDSITNVDSDTDLDSELRRSIINAYIQQDGSLENVPPRIYEAILGRSDGNNSDSSDIERHFGAVDLDSDILDPDESSDEESRDCRRGLYFTGGTEEESDDEDTEEKRARRLEVEQRVVASHMMRFVLGEFAHGQRHLLKLELWRDSHHNNNNNNNEDDEEEEEEDGDEEEFVPNDYTELEDQIIFTLERLGFDLENSIAALRKLDAKESKWAMFVRQNNTCTLEQTRDALIGIVNNFDYFDIMMNDPFYNHRDMFGDIVLAILHSLRDLELFA